LDIRQTGASVDRFKAKKLIIRVDIDDFELNGRVDSEIKIKTQLKEFLIDPRLNRKRRNLQSVMTKTQESKKLNPQIAEQELELSINPNAFLGRITEFHKNFGGFVVDVGQHQMWAAQSIQLMPDQRFLTSGGLGAMGFSIPAAIGASIATGKAWVVVLGDGCAQLAAPELQTISEMNLPVVIYVLNNHQHGMVAQFQDENMESRYVGTKIGYSTPDFTELAKAYGFKHTFALSTQDQLPELEKLLCQNPKSPILVDVLISDKAKALPKMQS
jgi:acetolactate synthase-1/2/3 large subunit